MARAHARVADARRDFLHKASTGLVRRVDVIAVEDLKVSGMVRNRTLARAISCTGWAEFRSMLEYKAERYGRWSSPSTDGIRRPRPARRAGICSPS